MGMVLAFKQQGPISIEQIPYVGITTVEIGSPENAYDAMLKTDLFVTKY